MFIYDLVKNEVKRVTDFKGTDNFPMCVGDEIFYTSDETKILNLYSYDTKTGEKSAVTKFTDYDCLWPSRGGGRVIFQKGGYLYYYDTNTRKTEKIEITLGSDKPFVRPGYMNVSSNISSFTVSPSGKRAAFDARGEIFTVPAEHGVIRNLTRSDGLREMNVEWSPDGKYISYLAEDGGEYEIFIRPQDGSGESRQLTKNSDSWIIHAIWSLDSKKMAFSDKMNRLWILDVESGKKKEVDSSKYGSINNYSFAPDNNWICYTKNDHNRMTSIWVYSIDAGKTVQLTG